MLLPILALAGIILFGTTRAGKQSAALEAAPERGAPAPEIVDMPMPEVRAPEPTAPPPAPRLRPLDEAVEVEEDTVVTDPAPTGGAEPEPER